ncbi:MAG: hypothetical protein WDO68_19880 [Gammaproteobacteria bacterium]
MSDADLLSRWKRSAASSGEYNFRPAAPNQQWHTDVMYVWVAAWFYFLVSFVDAFSRYVVHHKLLISLDGKSVAIELQARCRGDHRQAHAPLQRGAVACGIGLLTASHMASW